MPSPAKRRGGKRAPPKPSKKVVKPPRRKAAAVVEGEVVEAVPQRAQRASSVVTFTPPPAESRAAIRHQAALSYISDINQQSVEWWHAHRFAHIPLDTFRKWSTKDQWVKRRSDYWRNVEAQVSRKVASEAVQGRVKSLKAIEDMRDGIVQAVRGGVVVEVEIDGKKVKTPVVPHAFNSREGAVRAFVQLDQLAMESEKSILGGLPLALGTGVGSTDDSNAPPVPFSETQLRAMSHAALRAQLAPAASTVEDGEEEPE